MAPRKPLRQLRKLRNADTRGEEASRQAINTELQRVLARAGGSIPAALADVRNTITASLKQIQEHVEELIKSIERSWGHGLVTCVRPLNDVMNCGSRLINDIHQSQFNLGENNSVGEAFSRYVNEITYLVANIRCSLLLSWLGLVQPRKKEDIYHAVQTLGCTLVGSYRTISVFDTLASFHKSPDQTQSQVQVTKPRHSMEDSMRDNLRELPYFGIGIGASRAKMRRPRLSTSFEELERLAYIPSKPYQDVPQAFFRRYQNSRKYLEMGSMWWLCDNKKFLGWLRSPEPQFFVCEGPHGTGKSVIAARVVERLEANDEKYAHFFLGMGKSQTAVGVALALLAQVCVTSGYVPQLIDKDLVQSPGTQEPVSLRGRRLNTSLSVSTNDAQERHQGPEGLVESVDPAVEGNPRSIPNLQTVLEELHNARCGGKDSVFLVLDGWDVENMIRPDEFSALLSRLGAAGYKIFLTSRSRWPFPNDSNVVRLSLQGDQESDTPPQLADVELCVAMLLREANPRSDEIIGKCHLTRNIATQSDARFDLAMILTTTRTITLGTILDVWSPKPNLRRPANPMAEEEKIIKNGLSETRQRSKDGEANLLLTWLCCSPIPLTTTALDKMFRKVYRIWKRLLTANIDDDDGHPRTQCLDEENRNSYNLTEILERCQPFVTVDYGNGLVQFASPTVERLTRETTSDSAKSTLAIAVAETSLYLLENIQGTTSGYCSTEEQLVNLLRSEAFLIQAANIARYFVLISDANAREREEIEEKITKLLKSQKRKLLMQVYLYLPEVNGEAETECSRWDELIRSIDSITGLHAAAFWGLLTPVKALLEEEPQAAEATDSRRSRPLHEAAKSGSIAVLEAVLQASPLMANEMDINGRTPLFYARRGNHREAIVKLFEARCCEFENPEQAEQDRELAAALPEYCVAKSELAAGADGALAKSIALLRAIEEDLDSVAKLLILRRVNGGTAVDGTSALYVAVNKGKDRMAAKMVRAGARPTALPNKQPVLHIVARKQMPYTFTELLNMSIMSDAVDINALDSEMRTALFSVIETDDEQWASRVTGYILRRGLDVNILDKNGNHAMHMAAEKGFTHAFKMMRLFARLPEAPKDKYGKTPLDIALEHGHHGLATFIDPFYVPRK